MNLPTITCGLLGAALLLAGGPAAAQHEGTVVRIAKLQIKPTQLANYQAALKEEIETSVRVEPGVLSLYAVGEKDNPARITIMEVYASQAAYLSHLQTPHFKKYKASTQAMIQALELVETVPIVLEAKPR